jgi:chemotaxis protein MotB
MATFADMATLLMAFFVLILSFAEINIPKYRQIAGSLQAALGVQRVVPDILIPKARTLISESFTPSIAERAIEANIRQRSLDTTQKNLIKKTEENRFDYDLQKEKVQVQEALRNELKNGQVKIRIVDEQIVVELTAPPTPALPGTLSDNDATGGTVSEVTLDVVAKVAEVQATIISEVAIVEVPAEKQGDADSEVADGLDTGNIDNQAVNDRYEELIIALSKEIGDGLAEVESDGESIIVRFASQGSFDSGEATLKSTFAPMLQKLGGNLNDFIGSIRVEGHTDSLPVVFSQRFRSNWDLSAARAAAVADYLANNSPVNPEAIEILGFADTRPIGSNDTPQGRERNRRIEVILEPEQ